MPAILFGSIGTLVDTSELQRQSFNRAFTDAGLDWEWSQTDYQEMLGTSGGADRVAQFARSRGEDVDAAAVHRAKSAYFQEALTAGGVSARPGVVDTIKGAKDQGLSVGLVTTTSPDNVAAVMQALSPALSSTDFDVVVDLSSVEQPKPDKAAYAYALEQLGESATGCVAIEDNVGGVQSAVAAGVPCLAFPGENNVGGDFGGAQRQVDRLELAELQQLVAQA